MSRSALGLRASLSLAIRLSWRDLRGGFRGFRVFLACIALGVTAIVGVNSTARSLADSISREGRQILGGDLSLSLIHREMNADERNWVSALGDVSEIATMRAMARKEDGDSTLVELKAIGPDYPRLGKLATQPLRSIADLTGLRHGLYGFVAEDSLASRLDLKVGDRILIGDAPLELRALLVSEPDKLAGGVGFGPRAIISQDALRTTGLLQPGSLVRWTYRLLVSPPAGAVTASDDAVQSLAQSAEARFPEAGWQVRTRANVSNQFSKNLSRFSQFLTLVGLTALVIGGVGVANAVRAYVERKTPDLATLKAVGATGGYVFAAALLEVMLVTGIGVLAGVTLGACLPFLLASVIGPSLPAPFEPAFYPAQAAAGMLYGFLTALAFSLAALGRTHDVSVAALFRDRIDASARWPRVRYVAMATAAGVALIASIVVLSTDRKITMIYVAATFGGFVLLRLVGAGLMYLARRAPRARRTEVRLAIANIHRPGALTQSLVLSLGLGLALLVTLTLIDANIRGQLQQGMAGRTPSFFFLDIPNRQVDAFDAFIVARAPTARLERAPMMRGRLVRVNEVPVEKINAAEQAAWVLEGDRGITYAADVPEGSKLAGGEWWPRDYRGPPLVSLEAQIATGLGLSIGDSITVNVLGRNVTARVANVRTVNWRSFGINFVFVFSPSTFAGAPHMYLATAAFPAGTETGAELSLLKQVANAYPSVTSVRVKDTLEAISRIVDQLAFAVRGATSITLAASVLVLAGALSAGQRERVYDAVVLKTLGATRGRLLLAYVLEYGILGLATAAFSVAAGGLAAWAIVTKLMLLEEFVWAWSSAGLTAALALLTTLTLGLASTWRVLGQKPARHLKDL
ncbi:MAG: glycosyl transferase family 1 [Hyphomicrobiales bacterium]|nr:glycosyl transferase family 1 [Hyphomicrobiales bacterium]